MLFEMLYRAGIFICKFVVFSFLVYLKWNKCKKNFLPTHAKSVQQRLLSSSKHCPLLRKEFPKKKTKKLSLDIKR